MARFYSNENFRKQIVHALIDLGHDVLTSYDAGNANLKISDTEVIEFAKKNNRIILTFNRKDFIKLHNQNPEHSGIIVCTEDKNNIELAVRIHLSIELNKNDLSNKLIRINRPHFN